MSELFIYSDDDSENEINIESNYISGDVISNNSNDELNHNLENNILDSDFQAYQENINEAWINAPEEIQFEYMVRPLIYYSEYDLIPNLELSNKMILPSSILKKISKYEGIVYPLSFKINDSSIILSPHDFKEDIEHVYLPEKIFSNFLLNIDGFINLTLVNKTFEKGTKIKIKPHTSNFLDINDHKHFLEDCLIKNYTTLTKNQTISVNYYGNQINLDILECEPSDIISIVDTDLEVDFEKPYDYVEPPPPPPKPKTPEPTSNSNQNPSFSFNSLRFNNTNSGKKEDSNEKKPFVPFSGVGRRLGDK